MKKYEIMYILKANLEDAVRQETIDGLHAIITSHEGTIDNVDEWGIKEFAYEINDEKKGYYVVIKVTANNEGIQEFDRLARINNNVVRFLIVKEDKSDQSSSTGGSNHKRPRTQKNRIWNFRCQLYTGMQPQILRWTGFQSGS